MSTLYVTQSKRPKGYAPRHRPPTQTNPARTLLVAALSLLRVR